MFYSERAFRPAYCISDIALLFVRASIWCADGKPCQSLRNLSSWSMTTIFMNTVFVNTSTAAKPHQTLLAKRVTSAAPPCSKCHPGDRWMTKTPKNRGTLSRISGRQSLSIGCGRCKRVRILSRFFRTSQESAVSKFPRPCYVVALAISFSGQLV